MRLPGPLLKRWATRQTLFIGLAILALSTAVGPVLAQTFIEPTTPLGGTTAAPLNSSSTTQRKAGSLLIGPNGANPSKLCLNAAGETSDPQYCISSWAQLQGSYVLLHTEPVTGSPASPQIGYARIKGAANQGYTLIAEAANVSNAAAVYATDGGNSANFAGYFNGKVYIGDGTGTSAKELCLNAADTDISDGKGCISNWSAISSLVPSGSFVLLQSTPGPTTVQTGGEALTGAGSFGGVVLGQPAAGTALCTTCGDGMCGSGETTANCPAGGVPPTCPNVPQGDC